MLVRKLAKWLIGLKIILVKSHLFKGAALALASVLSWKKFLFFTSVLNIAGKTRYIGRYLRNKLAEKFNCLEQVKAQGIQNLVANLECIISEYFYSGAYPDPLSNFDKLIDYRNAWQWKYSGYFDDFLARMKIRQLEFRRSST